MSSAETVLEVHDTFKIDYGDEIETEIDHLKDEIARHPKIKEKQCLSN